MSNCFTLEQDVLFLDLNLSLTRINKTTRSKCKLLIKNYKLSFFYRGNPIFTGINLE